MYQVGAERPNLSNTNIKYTRMLAKDFLRNKYVYLMALPVLAYYIAFKYYPMYGVIIAFKDFTPSVGIIGSDWVGLQNFYDLFSNIYFWRILRNTILINTYLLLFGFPAPIILALLLNEVKNKTFKRTVQTVTYLPHFISVMVICGMIYSFCSMNGIINDVLAFFGGTKVNLLMKPEYFRTIFVSSVIWQEIGWNCIIYLAALAGINHELYEAATIDGAGRFKRFLHVTIPGIMPTVIILLILKIGSLMNIGFERVILLYNPTTFETGDVISSFVYRLGILEQRYSFSAAVGLFNSLINFILLISANRISKKFSETSLW